MILFSRWFRSIFLLSVVILGLGFVSGNALALTAPSKLYQIKAGFLLRFTSYVKWPASKNAVFHLCIVGMDPFGEFIDRMLLANQKKGLAKKMDILRKSVGDSVTACQMIFVTEESATNEFWKSLPRNHSILLVSEYDSFNKEGGIVSYYEENNRVRFEINKQAANKAKLIISSELLKLARLTSGK